MKNIVLLLSFLVCFGCVGQKDDPKGNQRAFYECSEPIKIDSNQINVKSGKLYFQFNINQSPNKLKSMDFFWLDNKPKGYFTAYLVNTTDSVFKAERQDGSLIMIQEALDEKGNWKPIEYWTYSGCGNSYFNPLKLDSGKCVLIPIKKYTGDFKTKMRLKFKNWNDIIYSDTFEGTIEKSQFDKETKTVNGILYLGPANYLDNEK